MKKGFSAEGILLSGGIAILGFIILIVYLSVGGSISDALLTQQATYVSTVYNQSILFTANNSYYRISYNPIIAINCISNQSNATPCIPASRSGLLNNGTGSYVLIYTNGTGSWPSTIGASASANYQVNYTFSNQTLGEVYNITAQGQAGLLNIGTQIPLLGTVIILGLVISLIGIAFLSRGKNKA